MRKVASRDILGPIRSRHEALVKRGYSKSKEKSKIHVSFDMGDKSYRSFGVKLKMSHDVLVISDDRKVLRRQ